jgi:ABC-type branched-subunit amino acid transport system permease subunit|tara:strand:+ start:98 stop:589 length:492 start_codon:yes stop_codon:yes gene_type:complete
MNKKGGVPDGIFYIVAIFTLAIVSIVGYMTLSNINEEFQTTSGISTQGKNLIDGLTNKYVGIIDASFLMVFVGVLIGTVAGVWFIRVHPALFWIMIPIFAFIIFLSAIYANVFWNFSQNANIIDNASEFTIISFVLKNYAYVITGVVILISLALFAKGRGEMI